MSTLASAKFDAARADDYAVQARIALAGYDACHELSACLLAATLGRDADARILVGGAGGTAQEVLAAARLAPRWHFVAVDPAAAMLDRARDAVRHAGLTSRVTFHRGTVADVVGNGPFDAATLIGVLHHLPGRDAKAAILADLASASKPGAPLIVAGNRFAYAARPLFLAAWGERWRMHGSDDAEVEAKLGKILQGADPPASGEEVEQLLREAGFTEPTPFFTSIFWGTWIARRTA